LLPEVFTGKVRKFVRGKKLKTAQKKAEKNFTRENCCASELKRFLSRAALIS